MHIPDGFLSPRLWASCDLISGAMILYGIRRVSRELEEKQIPLMGVSAAFVFAVQMINLPVGGGTSGHILGGALLGTLLGPWPGLLVMSLVLGVQSLLFQDGGLLALGANIFNMGIIGTWGSGLVYRAASALFARSSLFVRGMSIGILSVVCSAMGCASLLTLSGVVSAKMAFGLIVGVHLVIGIGEGFVTGTVLQTLQKIRPELLR